MDLSELNRDQSATINRHPWETTRAKIVNTLLHKNKSKFHHILDIGSGDAFALKQLEKKNTADYYSAVDNAYTEATINRIKKQEGASEIRFFQSLPDNCEETNPADCLLLLDVLEHCENDSLILNESISRLGSSGHKTILITVPAFQSLFSNHDKILKHYRRYTRKKIEQLCLSNGLKIKKSGYFFFTLYLLRYFKVLTERSGAKQKKKTIDNWKGGKLKSKIIAAILWADFRFCDFLTNCRIHLPGLSCYCLCQKTLS